MGRYLNPGYDEYKEALNSEIYVDMSELIFYLLTLVKTEQKYLAVSRPRRFGKTMTANMISAYFDRSVDSSFLFEESKLANLPNIEINSRLKRVISWDTFLNKLDVIKINMIDFISQSRDVNQMISNIKSTLIDELTKAYPNVVANKSENLINVMDKIYNTTQIPFIIIIDEWDCIFREFQDDQEGQKKYLDFLNEWLKNKRYIGLAYLTGILPIKKYGKHSALNMFEEYSMLSPKQLARFVGFTSEDVEQLCKSFNLEYTAVKEWYDGYRISGQSSENYFDNTKFGNKIYEIYSPLSVVSLIRHKRFENYWNATESVAALERYININFNGLKDAIMLLMEGESIRVNTRKYQNDMTSINGIDDVLTLLIHLGYLGFDSDKSEVFIPNKELLDEFKNTISDDYKWGRLYKVLNQSQNLLEATWKCDELTVAKLVEEAHMKAGNQTYNSEAALSYAVRLAYFNAEQYYTLIPEMQAGKGYADLVYIPSPEYPDKPVLLVELKYDKDADTALEQIHRQKYPDSLEKYKGNIILVGINYNREIKNDSEEFKHHSCTIEKA